MSNTSKSQCKMHLTCKAKEKIRQVTVLKA